MENGAVDSAKSTKIMQNLRFFSYIFTRPGWHVCVLPTKHAALVERNA